MLPSSQGRLVVVGAGRWGINHIKTAHKLKALVGVVDSCPEALRAAKTAICEDANVKYYTDLDSALSALLFVSVIVATPPNTHFAVATKAISAKCPVLVEKPLCDSVADAEKLVDHAEKQGVLLMVDHLLHYSTPHRKLFQLVRSGFVGEVTRIKMTRMNFGKVQVRENVLWSLSPHDISILLSLCRNELPVAVYCHGQKVVSCAIEDYVDLTVHFEDGIRAQIEASWMHPTKERRLVVYGTQGALILNEATSDSSAPKLQGFKWSAKRKSDGSAVVIEKQEEDLLSVVEKLEGGSKNGASTPEKPPLQAALEHFLECQMKACTPTTDGHEGLRVLKVLDAATHSMHKDGAPVHLESSRQGAKPFVHSSAFVDSGAIVGPGTKVWHFSHVMSGARVGPSCNIGQNTYIGARAVLGKNVKVQNNVSIYDSVIIGDDVFLGPSCVFTNVKTPRSHFSRKHAFSSTTIGKGATIGANATIVCGVTLGPYSFVGAGAVVTKDIPAHAMAYGNPATLQGWVSTIGTKLTQVAEIGTSTKVLQCEECKEVYTLFEKGKDGSSLPCVVLNNEVI